MVYASSHVIIRFKIWLRFSRRANVSGPSRKGPRRSNPDSSIQSHGAARAKMIGRLAYNLMVDTGRVNHTESRGWITSVHGAGVRGGHHST